MLEWRAGLRRSERFQLNQNFMNGIKIEQYEFEKYRELWKNGKYSGPNAKQYGVELRELISGNCLDIGCGDCITMNELNKSDEINCIGLDITTDQCRGDEEVYKGFIWGMPFIDKRFDYSLSIDVLEHIPTEFIEASIREINRITIRKTYHYISTVKAVTEYKGEQVHLTVKPEEWWVDMFETYCNVEFELKFW